MFAYLLPLAVTAYLANWLLLLAGCNTLELRPYEQPVGVEWREL